MAKHKQDVIGAELLDQLRGGRDASTGFESNRLIGDQKHDRRGADCAGYSGRPLRRF